MSPDDPSEREETLALVLDELDRMARIVDDLLLLAKAEHPDFLTLGEVDLTDLAVDALANAQTLGDRRWTLDGFADRTVLADGQRLTQALMQLAANAVQHTRPGDVDRHRHRRAIQRHVLDSVCQDVGDCSTLRPSLRGW